VRVAVKKIEGVDSVTVSLNQGLATMTFKPDNRVAVEQVRNAIRQNGFSPKGADVRVQGRVVERDGGLALETLPGTRGYALVDHPEANDVVSSLRRTALGRMVVLNGVVPETATRGGEATDTIQVRRFEIR
jgi:copper chaperone CopZ